jgi:hypothetical protein
LYGVKACIENCRKPIFFSTDNPAVNRKVMDMLAAVFPGRLDQQPYGIGQLSPTSPLFWEGPVLDPRRDRLVAAMASPVPRSPNHRERSINTQA